MFLMPEARHRIDGRKMRRSHRPEAPMHSTAPNQKSFLFRGVPLGKTSPAYHSDKRVEFSALYISVRNRRIDEF